MTVSEVQEFQDLNLQKWVNPSWNPLLIQTEPFFQHRELEDDQTPTENQTETLQLPDVTSSTPLILKPPRPLTSRYLIPIPTPHSSQKNVTNKNDCPSMYIYSHRMMVKSYHHICPFFDAPSYKPVYPDTKNEAHGWVDVIYWKPVTAALLQPSKKEF